jgi:hypothetical protein
MSCCCLVEQVPAPQPASGGGQMGRSEMFIIENILLFSWASSQPQTRPQGAANCS